MQQVCMSACKSVGVIKERVRDGGGGGKDQTSGCGLAGNALASQEIH